MKTYLKAFAFLALILIGPCILQGFHAASRTAYASVTNPQSAQSNTALDSIGVEWSNIFSLIDAYYIDPVDHYACFQKTQAEGLSACLDPWSEYFSAKQWKEFNEVVSGNYAGVGMVLEPDADRLKLFPFPGEPAARAGIIANDVLLSVGTTKVTQARNYSESDVKRVVDLIRGNAGTAIAVTVLRGGSVIGPISITREHVTAPSVTYQEVKPLAGSASSPNAGYVKISFFGPSTAAEFQTALTNLTKNGKINRFFIFDLRGDGGGEVNACACGRKSHAHREIQGPQQGEGRGQERSFRRRTRRHSCGRIYRFRIRNVLRYASGLGQVQARGRTYVRKGRGTDVFSAAMAAVRGFAVAEAHRAPLFGGERPQTDRFGEGPHSRL